MIRRTQIFFDEELKKKKEQTKLSWQELIVLGVDTALKKPKKV